MQAGREDLAFSGFRGLGFYGLGFGVLGLEGLGFWV